MKNARCLSCGLVMKGRWKKGPPAACPRCGATDSKTKMRAALIAAKAKPVLTATTKAVEPT